MMRLVLVRMAGQTPLRPTSPVPWPPSFGPCSKIVGSNPCESSQRAAISPPGPAPITATVLVIGELSHGWDPGAISLFELCSTERPQSRLVTPTSEPPNRRRLRSRRRQRQSAVAMKARAADVLDAARPENETGANERDRDGVNRHPLAHAF